MLAGTAAPAGATFDENTIGCAGSATITDDDGATYDIDADDDRVVVPRVGSAAWQGSIATVTHNHSGEVRLELGPASVTVGEWGPAENAGDKSSASGTQELPEALANVPTGRYDVSGFHQGDEGRCSGSVTVEFEGSPFDTPIGVVTAGLTLLTGLLTVLALVAAGGKPAFRGRPVLGAIAGLLFGVFLAADLVFLAAVSSGTPLLVILPLLFLTVGVAGGIKGPLGRGRLTTPV